MKKFIPNRNHVRRKGRLLVTPYRLILTWINDDNRLWQEEAKGASAASSQQQETRDND
ncbi:hypothetical protein [Pseudomonas sp.]|uniref:hypothetical protein n=1 Tax=Pseudomonas sp. TaxID=306 RepID=UPI00289C95E6|nr:hypothetical protein [Pseudomonas sp.]